MLRYVDGEWINVSQNCKREMNLGYDECASYSINGGDDQLDSYKYDMAVNDEDVDDEDNCMPNYHNNWRPDTFWMGDGFHEQMRAQQCRLKPVSMMRDCIRQRGEDSGYDDDARNFFGSNHGLIQDHYPTFLSITLIGKAVRDNGQPQPPPLQPVKHHSVSRGCHPYSRPIATTFPLFSRLDSPPKRTDVAKSGCRESLSEVERKIDMMPVEIKWREKEQDPQQKQENQGTTTITKIHQKSDKHVPTEIIDDSDKGSMITKIGDTSDTD